MTKGNEMQQNMRQTQNWENMQSKLQLIHEKAKADRKLKFTTLLHHVYEIDCLKKAYFSVKRDAAPGLDRRTWKSYGEDLEGNLQDLSERLKRGAYRAKPVKRVYIPKADGKQRPLGIPVLEDKIVQRAVVEVLNAIYEADFLGFSYGFRPRRNQHRALDALYAAIMTKKVNWILDADISDFFSTISHKWMVEFVEHRIADKRVVRLIQKWLNAGVLEDGEVRRSEEGTPQGGSASPLLANIYLHYVYDQWIEQWRNTKAKGEVAVVRFADDTIVGFQYKEDALEFQEELKQRLGKFGLKLHPEKTRLIEFGRFAARDRERRGEGKPETFTFLGFRHICSTDKKGRFTILRETIKKRLIAKAKQVRSELRRRINDPIIEVGEWLKKVLQGHYQYYGVPRNWKAMGHYHYLITRAWHATLSRRSQKGYLNWERYRPLIDRWLPRPKLHHPHPLTRFQCQHPR